MADYEGMIAEITTVKGLNGGADLGDVPAMVPRHSKPRHLVD